jgi:hypothetical protein
MRIRGGEAENPEKNGEAKGVRKLQEPALWETRGGAPRQHDPAEGLLRSAS